MFVKQELNKASLKPFFMRIWGQAEPAEVNSGTINAKEKGNLKLDYSI